MKDRCVQRINYRRIVLEEKRSKITFVNNNERYLDKVTVDNCEIIDGVRCDYLLIDKQFEYYIELKGEDIEHAFDQIASTIEQLSLGIQKLPKFSFVICSRSPLASTQIQNIQVKFRRKYNATLIVKRSPHEFKLE